MIISNWIIVIQGTNRSNELLKTTVKTILLAECNETLINYNKIVNRPEFRGGINASQYCANDPETHNDSCQGDSGGPLQFFPLNSSIATVVGIVSFGVSCGSTLPSLYTRVAYYLDWIEPIVWPNP